MASQKTEEDIQCEYVYEKEKGAPQNDANIFDGEYSDGDSDKDGSNLRVNPVSTNNGELKSSKKKRRSKYDEDLYAIPDSDEESEIRALKLKLETKETQLVLKDKKLRAWKHFSFVSIFVLVISAAGIAYLTVEITNLKGKTIDTTFLFWSIKHKSQEEYFAIICLYSFITN